VPGPSSTQRTFLGVLAAIAMLGLVLRGSGLAAGAWLLPVDYDEGVYFTAASLLLRGELPYRDFVFVHPPGWPALLALTSAWLSPATGFAIARWIAVLFGGLNIALVGVVARRWLGPVAGLSAALFYATYPEVVAVERGPFLEPALNFACLAMTYFVSRASERGATRWAVAAGIAGGLALAIKLWAVAWLLGATWAIAAMAPRFRRAVALTSVLSAAGTFLLLVAPWVLAAPHDFMAQVISFHLVRPPDGLTSIGARAEQLVAWRHLVSPLLALGAVSLGLARRSPTGSPAGRVVTVAWLAFIASFLTARAYWSQYNSHLVASEAILAGALVSWLSTRLTRRAPRLVAGALLVVAVALSLFSVHQRTTRSTALVDLAQRLAPLPADECVFAFEPAWTLAAGRLPPRVDGGLRVVDPYAVMLDDAARSGVHFASADDAFAEPLSAVRLRPLLERCRHVVLGPRGRRQLNAEAMKWFQGTHTRTPPTSSDAEALDVWSAGR